MRRREYVKFLSAAALAASRQVSAATSKGRFRPAICAYSFRNQLKDKSMSYGDVIRMAADWGADGVDLTSYWLADTTDEALFALRRLAYKSGVALYTVGVRAYMAQPTKELQAGQVESVRKWLDVAQRLGSSHMRVFGGPVPKGANEEQAVSWSVETLKRCAEDAAKKGIILGVEDDGGITTNADRTVEIVTKANSPWVGINLDIGNFRDDAYRQIEICAPYATNVHAKSQVHVDHQAQPTNWSRTLGILGSAGFHGYLAIEYEANDNPLMVVPELLSKMRAAIQVANQS